MQTVWQQCFLRSVMQYSCFQWEVYVLEMWQNFMCVPYDSLVHAEIELLNSCNFAHSLPPFENAFISLSSLRKISKCNRCSAFSGSSFAYLKIIWEQCKIYMVNYKKSPCLNTAWETPLTLLKENAKFFCFSIQLQLGLCSSSSKFKNSIFVTTHTVIPLISGLTYIKNNGMWDDTCVFDLYTELCIDLLSEPCRSTCYFAQFEKIIKNRITTLFLVESKYFHSKLWIRCSQHLAIMEKFIEIPKNSCNLIFRWKVEKLEPRSWSLYLTDTWKLMTSSFNPIRIWKK